MKGHLHTLHVTIIAAMLLVIGFSALFILQGGISGKATTGDVASTAFIINTSGLNCTLTAGMGYNVISIPCITAPTSVVELMNNTQVAAIYQYVPSTSDVWKVYNPNLPSYVINDLQFMTRRSGYIAIMNAPANVSIEGAKALSTDIILVTGWNLVGYPTNITRNISASLATISATTTRVEAYNKSAESYIFYPGDGLNDTYPGLGYWINSTVATTWTVNG